MASIQRTFLVTGTLNSQGEAAARQLLFAGHQIRTLARYPLEPISASLQQLGAVIIEGDCNDISALQEAATGCSGVFILTETSEAEIQQARNIVNAAKSAGISKAVYSGPARAEESETFDSSIHENAFIETYWSYKRRILEVVQSAGFQSCTILQTAWMMTDWVAPVSRVFFKELRENRLLLSSFGSQTTIPLTAPEDVAAFTVKALTDGLSVLRGKPIRIASEYLTIGETAAIMTEVSGLHVDWKIKSVQDIEKEKSSNPLVATQLWERYDGFKINIERLNGYGVTLTSFRQYLECHKEQLLDGCGL